MCYDSGGVVILSKYPIVSEHEERFTNNTSDDGLGRQKKGFVSVSVQKDGVKYIILSTHLSPYPTHADVRKKQLREIAKYLKKNQVPFSGSHFIITGDFNVADRGSEVNNMYKILKVNNSIRTSPLSYPFSYDPRLNTRAHTSHEKPQNLDYLLVPNNVKRPDMQRSYKQVIRPVKIKQEKSIYIDLSDHFALFEHIEY